MGLQEKRLAQTIQQKELPEFQAELHTITGFEPQVEILWDTFIAYDTYPLSRLTGSLFREITQALASICTDDLGKSLLKANLTTIRLENTDDEEKVVTSFEDKILYIKAQLVQGVYHMPGSSQIQELIEKKL